MIHSFNHVIEPDANVENNCYIELNVRQLTNKDFFLKKSIAEEFRNHKKCINNLITMIFLLEMIFVQYYF